MSSSANAGDNRDWKRLAMETAILPLSETSYKGSSGRVAVLGGSAKFTGAPYYAAMASLKVGADLAYVFTAEEAALPIKCYSPELMVAPVYRASEFDQAEKQHMKDQREGITSSSLSLMSSSNCQILVRNMVQEVTSQIQRVHCLVIGPGLGRSPLVFEAVARIIKEAQAMGLHLVLDADALFMLSLPQYQDLLQGYEKAIVTPNAMEYKLLFPETATTTTTTKTTTANETGIGSSPFLQGVTVVRKGRQDAIERNGKAVVLCEEPGGPKRSGGIGDVLAGTLGALVSWKDILERGGQQQMQQNSLDLSIISSSCWTACWIVKRATAKAFHKKKRSMTAPDVLEAVGLAVEEFTNDSTAH